jgi:type IV pilus assembly protein PilM
VSDSIWKKEISFKKKEKAPAVEQPKSESTSIWKKEISLGGGKKDKPKQEKAPKAEQPKSESTSIWKKEISLGGGKKKEKKEKAPAQDDAVARLVELATQAVEPEFDPVPPVAEPVYAPTQLAEAIVAATPVVDPEPIVIPEPEPVAFVEPVVEPVAYVAPEPVAAESWLAEPELPTEPFAVEEPVVLHPPVPAAELPPLPAEPSQPFWKKEISFGGKAKAPRARKVPKDKGGGEPFWKKELSLSRGPKAAAEPKPAKAPRAKRQLSLPQLSLPSLNRGGGGHQVKRLVGLKVGGSQLAAARIANNGAAELLQVARQDLEPGVVIAGELRDPDALAAALKQFFAANKLPRKGVRLGIASNRIGVRTFDIAGIDDAKQLENAIHFRAQETLPIPLDEAVLDYHILEERIDDEGNPTKRVLLVVAYRELIDRYVAACRQAGITLAGIDLEAFALLRALGAPRAAGTAAESALVAVAVGHDRSTFAVSDGRVCEFTRVLEWGGASLNVAIARALDLAPSEAESVKRLVSLASAEVPQGLTPEQYALAVDAVRKQVQAFARELVSSLQFYQNQPGSLGIGEIVITGGTASLDGLADELQRLIGVRVRVGDPLARLKMTKKIALDDPVGSLAVAIGLGIED